MTSATGRAAKGLTFIEILFVIIIAGALSAASMPGFRKAFNDLELNSVSRELQAFMHYLRERSIVESKIIYFNIDVEKKECWAQIKGAQAKLKTYSLPKEIRIEAQQKQAIFYPDGSIDNVNIKLSNLNNQAIVLTTKGVYGKVKLQIQ